MGHRYVAEGTATGGREVGEKALNFDSNLIKVKVKVLPPLLQPSIVSGNT